MAEAPLNTETPTSIVNTPALHIFVLGYNTSIDVMYSMGEVTNAYVTLKNIGNLDLINMAERNTRTIWEKKGSMDIHAHATAKVKEVMTTNAEPLIPSEIDEKIQAEFPGLVKGLLEPIS